MDGLMMDFQLTLPVVLRRAETLFATKEIVSRRPDKTIHRYTYADMGERARRLAVALTTLGIAPGERVATLCWNHSQHLEAYFGIPLAGAVLHTLNPRLGADDLAYIVDNAGDAALLVDEVLLPVFEKIRERVRLRHVIVVSGSTSAPEGMQSYDRLLAEADPSVYVERETREDEAASMCYSSGTTGRPKGVLYSHRAIVLHSMGEAMTDALGLSEADTLLPVVPMFHVNAWGLPYTCALVGATLVLPGPHLDPESLLERVIHAWGMTETTPLGTVGNLTSVLRSQPEAARDAVRAKQGMPVPFVEIRARGENGLVPWDGEAMGELEVRGPWVARAYYHAPEAADRFTEDGWFKTGDVVSIDPAGYILIRDRSKDLVKSGGEWISTLALEGALMGHPAVAEAAVIAVAHPKWQERPLAIVVLKQGKTATATELLEFLAPSFPKWQLPDAVEFVDAIPRTATGKFLKTALRERFKDYTLAKTT